MNITELSDYFEDKTEEIGLFKEWINMQIRDEQKANREYARVAGKISPTSTSIETTLHAIADDELRHEIALKTMLRQLTNINYRVRVTSMGGTVLNIGSVVSWREFQNECSVARGRGKNCATGEPMVSLV